MPVVGEFMNVLFQGLPLPHQRVLMDTAPSLPQRTHEHFVQPLYSCLSQSQLELVCLILNIFSGIPEAYQVLHCKASTTEEDLSRFLKRVEMYRGHYLMLDVNRLPFKLQEVSIEIA